MKHKPATTLIARGFWHLIMFRGPYCGLGILFEAPSVIVADDFSVGYWCLSFKATIGPWSFTGHAPIIEYPAES